MLKDIDFRWQDIAVHNDKVIYGFFPPYRWLSNFHPCKTVEGYPTVENGYMASKVKARHRPEFKHLTPREAKAKWKYCELVDKCAGDWDERKVSVMRYFLEQKFDKVLNPELWMMLQDTGSKELVELNYWGDFFWGVDYIKGGQNMLGKLLMEIREETK
jgi:ribA/ribD-fused uncharacterized protein